MITARVRGARLSAVAMLWLGGCSGGNEAGNAVDLEAAAAQAQANIDRYAAASTQPTPVPAAPAAFPTAPAPGPLSSPTAATPVPVASRTSADAGRSAVDARALVERYFALIGSGKYEEARGYWEQGGAASGLDAHAFAASFRRFAQYRATVGEPYDEDAGAGQVYISVPVRLSGTLRDGGQPFRSAGTMILHRVNGGIDGTTAADRRWSIRRFDPIAALPSPAPTASPAGSAR